MINIASERPIGRRIAIFLSGIGYQILSRRTDRISDIGYRISESDIIKNRLYLLMNGKQDPRGTILHHLVFIVTYFKMVYHLLCITLLEKNITYTQMAGIMDRMTESPY